MNFGSGSFMSAAKAVLSGLLRGPHSTTAQRIVINHEPRANTLEDYLTTLKLRYLDHQPTLSRLFLLLFFLCLLSA